MLRREFLILWLLIVYSQVFFHQTLACSMLAMKFDHVPTNLVLFNISCFLSDRYWIILNSLALLDFLSYRYSETQHSSRTWFWLIYFEQRVIAVSWSWSNLIQIANQSIRLSWYSPILVILVQTWGFWYQLSMPAIWVVVFNIFCLCAILDFKNSRLKSVLVVAY